MPLRRYEHLFRHPTTGQTLTIVTEGETPCRAKNTAYEVLQVRVASDAALPNDNNWALVGRRWIGEVGVS